MGPGDYFTSTDAQMDLLISIGLKKIYILIFFNMISMHFE